MGLIADLRRWVTAALDREPRRQRAYWLLVAFGIVSIGVTVVGSFVPWFDVGFEFVLLGLAIGTMGAAELVPADRLAFARKLRICSYGCSAGYLAWLFGPVWLAASGRRQFMAIVAVPVVIGYVWLLGRALEA